MIPNGRIIISDDILQDPKNKSKSLTEAFEIGGIKLLDSSQGLLVKNYQLKTDSRTIFFKAEDSDIWLEVMKDNNITEVDLTFDQQMRLHLTWVSDGLSKFFVFDAFQSKQVIKEFPDYRNPRISLDDKRTDIGSGNSDIIFAYIRNDTNELCYRVQRDLYDIEYPTGHIFENTDILWKIGMGQNNAFLFYIIKDGEITDD